MAKKSTNKYVNNEKLVEEFRRYKQFCKEWEAQGKPKPAPLENFPYIGKAIYDIANNYVKRYDWSKSVVDRDSLVSAIIYDMVRYVHNVDPEQGSKVFWYMSSIAGTACIREYNSKLKFDNSVAAAYEKNMVDTTLDLATQGFPIGNLDEVARNMRYEGVDEDQES